MSWTALIAALVAFFKPVLQQWLTDLLKKIEGKLSGTPGDPTLAVHDVFTAARGQLWFWQFARRKQLDAAQRITLARAQQLAGIAKTGSVVVPVMTVAEYDALVNSI